MYKRARKGIGYLPQEPSVFRKLSVEDNIRAVLEMTDLSKEARREKLESLIDEFSLEKVRKSRGDTLLLAILFVGFGLGPAACTEPPPRVLTLEERRQADSLVQQEIKTIKPVLDSLCEAQFDSLVQMALDSILEERKLAMEKQLRRLREEVRKEKKSEE